MANSNYTLDQLLRGLYQTESSGRYNALGPVTKNGDRAYGISQVMGANVGPWTQQYFGQRLSPDQYLNNKDAQVAVTKGKLGELLNKYGNPQDAISTWFSGRPLRQAGNASDGFMNTPDYVNKVLNSAQNYDPRSMVATAPEGADGQPAAPQGSQSISLGDQENQQPLNNIGSTLANMGASIASLDRHGTGIASLNASRVASNLAQQEQQRAAEGGWKYAGQTQNGQGLMFQNSKGEIRVEPLAPGFAGKSDADLPNSVKEYNYRQKNPDYADYMDKKDMPEPTLNTEDLRRMALTRFAGGKQSAGDFGTGKQGTANRVAFQKTITDLSKELDLPPEELAMADSKGQYNRTVAQRIGNMDTNSLSAYQGLKAGYNVLKEASAAFGPRDLPYAMEQIRLAGGKQLQDPKLSALQVAIKNFTKDAARAANPLNNQVAVMAQREMADQFTAAQSHEALMAGADMQLRDSRKHRENAVKTYETFFGSKPRATGFEGEEASSDTKNIDDTTKKRLKYNPSTGELE